MRRHIIVGLAWTDRAKWRDSRGAFKALIGVRVRSDRLSVLLRAGSGLAFLLLIER